jgi:two-component system NtrC family sensor kinase
VKNYEFSLPRLWMQRGHLSQVFLNILQNAREAMLGHGRIEISIEHGEEYDIVITISDNGPGISDEKLARIFEPYFTTKEKGTGLGLAIVKHICANHGGDVDVWSEEGRGSTFTIRLPAAADRTGGQTAVPSQPDQPAYPPPTQQGAPTT